MAERGGVLLGDIADLIRGVSYHPEDLHAEGPDAVPLLRATNIGKHSLELAEVLYVPSSLVREMQQLRRFDVVIAMSSGSRLAVGRLAQLRQDWFGCVGAFCGVIRPSGEHVDPAYLGYALQSPDFRARIEAVAEGTAIMNLSRERLLGYRLRLPDRKEQRAIASVLGALDDKIELNRRLNETLEALARAIFTSWFVDFDPVRAKAEGRQPAGMDAETAALFPDSFEDSSLGPIPSGWHAGTLAEVASFSRQSLDPAEYPAETFSHYSIPAFDGGRQPRAEPGASIKSSKFLVPDGAVLASRLNPRIPRVWLPNDAGDGLRAIASTEFLVSVPIATIWREWILCLFQTRAFSESIAALATGTSGSHQRTRPHDVLAYRVAVPSRGTVAAFSSIARNLVRRVAANQEQTVTLAEMRDTTLPKLVSGVLRCRPRDEIEQRF